MSAASVLRMILWQVRHAPRMLSAVTRLGLKAWGRFCCRQFGHDFSERPICRRCGVWSPVLLEAAVNLQQRRDAVDRVIDQAYAASVAEAHEHAVRFRIIQERQRRVAANALRRDVRSGGRRFA